MWPSTLSWVALRTSSGRLPRAASVFDLSDGVGATAQGCTGLQVEGERCGGVTTMHRSVNKEMRWIADTQRYTVSLFHIPVLPVKCDNVWDMAPEQVRTQQH